jgi:hypothetical protein
VFTQTCGAKLSFVLPPRLRLQDVEKVTGLLALRGAAISPWLTPLCIAELVSSGERPCVLRAVTARTS